MSAQYVQIPHSIFSFGLSPGEIVLLVFLMKYGDRCYPPQKLIASQTQLSMTSVKKCLRSLKSKSLVNWKSGHNRHNNRYMVNRDAIWKKESDREPEETAHSSTNFDSSDSDRAGPYDHVPNARASDDIPVPNDEMPPIQDMLNNLGIAQEEI